MDEGSVFTGAEFETHLNKFKLHHNMAPPGAHHSNGVAEREIGAVMSISRAMLHHAAIHWPDAADVELWPLAVMHATHILNNHLIGRNVLKAMDSAEHSASSVL